MESQNTAGNQTPNAKQILMTMQLIAGAMIASVTVFGVITLVITMGDESHGTMVTYLAIGLGAMAFVLRIAVPGMVAKSQIDAFKQQEDAKLDNEEELRPQLLTVYQTQMTVGFALLEGACFFNLIAYIIERQVPTLVVTFVLLATMMSTFPARDRVEHWVDDQLRVMKP